MDINILTDETELSQVDHIKVTDKDFMKVVLEANDEDDDADQPTESIEMICQGSSVMSDEVQTAKWRI